MKKILFACLPVFQVLFASAQTKRFFITHFGIADGLATDQVLTILKDSNNYPIITRIRETPPGSTTGRLKRSSSPLTPTPRLGKTTKANCRHPAQTIRRHLVTLSCPVERLGATGSRLWRLLTQSRWCKVTSTITYRR